MAKYKIERYHNRFGVFKKVKTFFLKREKWVSIHGVHRPWFHSLEEAKRWINGDKKGLHTVYEE
jgi:hypothetical protein